MSKLIDITGQKFGRLTVLHRDTERKGATYWICQCDCGKIKSVKGSSLKRGEIVSCGCYRTERMMKTKEERGLIDDLTGQRFGFLTVIAKNPIRGTSGAVQWDCVCDCGNYITVQGSNLKRKDINRTVSCGCKHMPLGEIEIKNILEQNNISYSQQQTFKDLANRKSFDFAIFDGNNQIIRLIEFDGEQHYKEAHGWRNDLKTIQMRDQEKNKWAKEHNIPLVRIPYWERDKITLDMIMGDTYLV